MKMGLGGGRWGGGELGGGGRLLDAHVACTGGEQTTVSVAGQISLSICTGVNRLCWLYSTQT